MAITREEIVQRKKLMKAAGFPVTNDNSWGRWHEQNYQKYLRSKINFKVSPKDFKANNSTATTATLATSLGLSTKAIPAVFSNPYTGIPATIVGSAILGWTLAPPEYKDATLYWGKEQFDKAKNWLKGVFTRGKTSTVSSTPPSDDSDDSEESEERPNNQQPNNPKKNIFAEYYKRRYNTYKGEYAQGKNPVLGTAKNFGRFLFYDLPLHEAAGEGAINTARVIDSALGNSEFVPHYSFLKASPYYFGYKQAVKGNKKKESTVSDNDSTRYNKDTTFIRVVDGKPITTGSDGKDSVIVLEEIPDISEYGEN